MGTGLWSVLGRLSFRRIVDIPFEGCVAALDSWQRTWQAGELPIGGSRVRGPIEHDHDTGTCRIEVRLARGPLRPLVRMRLDIDRWSSSSTALELIPCGRIRPTARFFRASHLLLDSLTCSLPGARASSACPRHREPATHTHQAWAAALVGSGHAGMVVLRLRDQAETAVR